MKKLKKRKALWHKHRDYLQNEVLRLVNKANRGLQPERRVTYAAAIEVANRAIKRNGNVFSSARAFGALRAVNAFIEFATRGKDVVDAYKYADLLPVGHPSSTRSHSMTASALRHARARWYAADPLVDDELRPLVASAHAADYLSPERDYLFARLAAAPRSSLPLWLTIDVAEAIVAGALSFIGGNSSAARRARAQLQRRDRRGRFAFMGGGFSWGIKLGSVFRSLSGRVVGASGDDDVEIEVIGDPDLPDGIYALPAKRGEGVKAIIKPKKGAKATKIAVDKDAVDASTLVRKDAPSGWEAVKPKDAQKLLPSAAKLWRSADGYFVEETPEGDKVLRRIDLATNKPGNEVARSKSWADITKGALDDQDDFAKFIEAEAAKERAGAGEAVDLDPAKNITQQISDAVSSGKKVRFSYGGKERIITPEKISTGEKSGKRNLLGKDTDGNTKSFTLDKIEAPGAPGEQPEAPVNVPDNAVQFDPTGDLDAQLQQAIDNDAPVVFDYNGKTRVVFPQATKDGKPSYYTNPKNGNVNIIGNEAGSEQQKQYTLSKISKAGDGDTPPPPPSEPPTPAAPGGGDKQKAVDDFYKSYFEDKPEKWGKRELSRRDYIDMQVKKGDPDVAGNYQQARRALDKFAEARKEGDMDKAAEALDEYADATERNPDTSHFGEEIDAARRVAAEIRGDGGAPEPAAPTPEEIADGYDKYIADLREEASQAWDDITPAELRDWRQIATEEGYYVGAGATSAEQEKIYVDMYVDENAKPRAVWEAEQEEGPLGREVAPTRLTPDQEEIAWEGGSILLDNFDRDNAKRSLEAGFNDEENGGVYRRMAELIDEMGVAHDNSDWSGFVEKLREYDELGADYTLLPSYVGDTRESVGRLLSVIDFDPDDAAIDAADEVFAKGDTDAARAEAIKKIEDMLPSASQLRKFTEALDAVLDEKRRDDRSDEEIDQLAGDVVSGTPEGYDWREDPDGTVEDLIDAIADDQDLTEWQKEKMSRAVDVLLAGRDRDTLRREGGTFDREGFSRGQRRDWYIPEEGDGESIRLDADEVDGFYEIFSAPRGMYGARREMDIFRNGGQDAQEEEFDELFDSIEEAQEFVENQLEDLREGERQAERMVEEAAEAPADTEFDELFTTPEGAYKPRIFDLYTPKGRTTEDADDYTDDPAVLANKFDAATLGRALKGAVLPDGQQAADGEGLLPFDGGDEMVPAEALYEALQQKGLDADMLLAGMYDSLLDEPVNMDKVKQLREDMGVGPDEAPALTPTAGRDRDEAVRLNQEVAAPTRARRARELMADYEERNAKVTELAQAINDLEDGVTDEVGADDFTRAEFLSRILPWSQGTAEERDAFKGLWGLLQNLGGGDVDEGTALDVPGGGELESFEGIMTRALEAAFPDRDGRETLDELYDEYGGFADFVDGKSRIADGTDDLDSGSVAASFYRLTRAAARPNRVRLQRTIGVVPGSQLQATYTTPGEVFDMDARSFTSRDLTSEDLLSSMQFAPDSDLTQVVFVAAPGEADSFNASGVSWFGEGEHIGYGTYEVVSVKKVRDLLNPKRDKFAVEVRKARQRDERDIFEETTPDVSDWQMVGGQAGSNEGGFYRDSDGNEYYVKVPKSQAHAENEALAAALYELTGTPAARTILGEDNGETRIVSPLIPGAINELRDRLDDEDYIKQLRDGFVVDAWLANWDVAGLMFDNVMSDEDGNPVRVDPGGALMFRARGSEKGSNFGDRVGELDTLRDRDLNPQNSMVFGGVTDAELADQANRLRAIDPEAVDAVVDSIVTDPEMASTLKTRLRNRRADIIRRILGVDESDRDKPVATTTESVASRDLQAGDILNDGSFVVESAFVDDETPDGMVSVQGYYPGGQSQRLNFSADDLNDVARGGKTPPKGDLEPLHRPEVAPDATPEEVEAWRDALARFEVDKAVRAAMNCGGSGLTAAVGPENGPCSVPSVDELIKKASANPGDKAPQELPDKDGVDVSSAKFVSALKDAKKAVKETLQVIEEDDEVKPVIKKRAKKFVDTFNAIVADFNAEKIDAAEASEKIKAIVPAEDRANDDIDFIAVEFDNVADVLSGEAFKPKQEEGMPPPGVVNPKTGKPLGVSKDGVTIIRPGMLVRDKNGFAGVVARYANPGTADPKSAWHGVHVIGAIDGKQYNKVTWQLTPINPGDDDSIYIEGPDGYTGHKKKGTVIPKGSIKKGFKDWDKKAKDFHEKVAEEGKVPKASAPEGAPEPEETPEAPEAPEAPATKPIPATFDEISSEEERDMISDIVASFERVVALSPIDPELRELREKLADGEVTLKDIVDGIDKESAYLSKSYTPGLPDYTGGKSGAVKTQLENATAMVEQLEGTGSVFVGENAANLPPIDIVAIDPDDTNELWSNEFDVEEKTKRKYGGLASLARVLSRSQVTVSLEDGSRATFEDVADMVAKSKGSMDKVPIMGNVEGFIDSVELALRRVMSNDPIMAVDVAAHGLVLKEEGKIPSQLSEKLPGYDELASSILDMRELAKTAEKIADLDLSRGGSAVDKKQKALVRTAQDFSVFVDRIDRDITDFRGENAQFNDKYLSARDLERKRRQDALELRKKERGEGFSPRVPEAVDLDANPVDWSTPATPAVLSLDEAASRSLAIQQQRASEPRSDKRTTSDVVQTLGDGSDIEDMAVNIVTGVDQGPDGYMASSLGGADPNEVGATTRYQFKLTAWAADDFYKQKIEGESAFRSSQEINVPTTGFAYGTEKGEFGLWSSSTQVLRTYRLPEWEASYGKDGSGTYRATVNVDGVDVSVTYIRARDRRDVIGKAYDGQVTIDVPAGTQSSVVSKAFQYMGVRNPSATTQEDIQLLVENRLLSVLAGDSDPAKYVSNPAKRAELLDRIFDKYGVRASDFDVRVGSTGRVEIVGPESLGKAIRNETEIDILLHTLSVENFAPIYDSMSDRLDKVMDGFANLLKPGQGLRSTTSRRLRGSSASGQSSTRDVETGGADYVYMSPSGSQSSWSVQLYGGTSWDDAGISVIYDPETMFRRIDWYANQDDLYGFRETPSEYNPEENFDFIVERAKPRSHEVMFKGDVGNDAIAFIVVNNKTAKEVLLTKLREKGVETINGQPIEVVVTYGIVKDRVALEGNKFSTTIGDREYLESVAGPL